MLSVKTTEKLAGVTVSGTYWGLNALYDALTNVIGEEESYPEFEACRIRVLGLCYDILNVRLRKEKPILLPYRRKFCLTTQIMMHWKMVSMNLQEYAVYHIMKSN